MSAMGDLDADVRTLRDAAEVLQRMATDTDYELRRDAATVCLLAAADLVFSTVLQTQ